MMDRDCIEKENVGLFWKGGSKMNIKEINELHRTKLPASNRVSKNKGFQEIMDRKMSEIEWPLR